MPGAAAPASSWEQAMPWSGKAVPRRGVRALTGPALDPEDAR
jgi:hypothetical protein